MNALLREIVSAAREVPTLYFAPLRLLYRSGTMLAKRVWCFHKEKAR